MVDGTDPITARVQGFDNGGAKRARRTGDDDHFSTHDYAPIRSLKFSGNL
jgi:hypothetical protein